MTGSLKTAYGLFAACLRAFTAIRANVSGARPYFRAYASPAPLEVPRRERRVALPDRGPRDLVEPGER
ncbi:hypothetical protein GCM10020295_80980 [Streptomyces cinereospinus]